MRISKLALALVLLSTQFLFQACSGRTDNSNTANVAQTNAANTQSSTKDNVEELLMLVRLPFEPEEAVFQETPEHKKLIAVIRFSPEDATKMTAEVGKVGQGSPETVSVEDWYPVELKAQGELTGESIVKGQSFSAEPFLTPPYTKGRITRIENTDYFILQISS